MGILSWFKKKEPEDIGQVLATLAQDIQRREMQLGEIRLRERRATLLVTLYTFAAWGAYLSLWYTQLLPQMSGHRPNSPVEKAAKGFPAILGPIIILFTRRIVQLWYNRKGNAEEKSLAALRLERRSKVEDFKRRTNYYETRELLERYEDGQRDSVGPAARPIDSPSSRHQLQQLPATPQRAVPAVPPNTPANIRTSISPALQSQLTQTPQEPLPPPRKLWYDKLADALLGEDESPKAAASRYALICQKCFSHNGLVKEEMWEDAQYVCPKCGHFNPSARSQRKGLQTVRQSSTMQTPTTPQQHSASPQTALHPPTRVDESPRSEPTIADIDS